MMSEMSDHIEESDDRGADGLPTLTYEIRLKKRYQPAHLLGALQHRLGPRLTEIATRDGPPEPKTPPAEPRP